MQNSTILLLLLASSALPALIIFLTPSRYVLTRNITNLSGIFSKIFFVLLLFHGLAHDEVYSLSFAFTPHSSIVLKVDTLSMLFATLSSILWLFTTIYAIAYFKDTKNQNRFFGFFSLCVTATVGLSVAGNLFTFFIFYEFLTLTTFALILHTQTVEAKKATIIYLAHTIIGGLFFLVALVVLQSVSGDVEFQSGGYLGVLSDASPLFLQAIFVLLLIGIGVKAAIFPLHHWLPSAMAAPAPVSALLHAVAVVKAGAFGLIRVVYEVYGVELSRSLGLLDILLGVAVVTILFGSIMALRQLDIKKLLAYSTVSQVSYILLGIALFGPLGTIGAMVHLVHQGVMKITLFFCAGAFAKLHNIKKIDQLDGLGKVMPFGALAFSIAALGMIGIPPTAGFISKYYLALGAYENELLWVLGVLALSSLLNAMYFLPLLYRIWFLAPKELHTQQQEKKGANLFLLLPALVGALLSLLLGVFALSDWSPLGLAEKIVELEYRR
ncbi:MAG: proton-conducting transporter membrane subunit [Sulfuricurvum sp.]|nr:proton-conducting transporter membrane subunit [Sulfuricurvum sp.]MDP3023810.1 proton-conducting transporter membrane subunit [Sulfuricurvum sp.]